MNSLFKSLFLSISFCAPIISVSQTATIDSLLLARENTKSLINQAWLDFDIAWEYLYLNPEKSLEFSQQGLAIATKEKDSLAMATGHGMLGLYYDISGKYFQSAEAYQNAITLLKNIPDSEGELATNYNNLSVVFKLIRDYNNAIHYQKLALKYEQKTANREGEILSYINLGVMYNDKGMLDSSFYYHKKAISVGIESGSKAHKNTLINMANLFNSQGIKDSASYYFIKYYNFAKQCTDSRKMSHIAHAYRGMATVALNNHNYQNARKYADSAITVSQQIKYKNFEGETYIFLSKILREAKKFEEAYKALEKGKSIQDSIINQELHTEIERLHTLFEIELKEETISELEIENRLIALEITKSKNEKTYLRLISVFSGLFFIITGILLYQSRKKSSELILKNKYIENLVRESNHRIKNNLQMVSSLLSLQTTKLNNISTEQALNQALNRVKSISLIHQKLQVGSFNQELNLGEFIQDLSYGILRSYNLNPGINLKLNLNIIFLDSDKSIYIGLILNEWITNSIKYAKPIANDVVISISTHTNNDEIILNYRDNGIGFNPNKDYNGLGNTIVMLLTKQLKSALNEDHNNGVNYTLTI